jgi:hypothetical protein
MFLSNSGICLQDHMVSKPVRPESEQSQPQKSQNLQSESTEIYWNFSEIVSSCCLNDFTHMEYTVRSTYQLSHELQNEILLVNLCKKQLGQELSSSNLSEATGNIKWGFSWLYQSAYGNAVISGNRPQLPPTKSALMSLFITVFAYHLRFNSTWNLWHLRSFKL